MSADGGRPDPDADRRAPVEPPASEPAEAGSAGGAAEADAAEPAAAEPAATRAIDVGAGQEIVEDATAPVEVTPTGPFAPTSVPDDPGSLVSSTDAHRLLSESAPEEAVPVEGVPAQPSAIDTLFADSQFRDYEGPPASAPRPAPRPVASPAPHEPPHMTATQRVLLAIAGGLVALVALGALFFLGTRLPLAAAPASSPTPRAGTPAPTPVPTVLPPGPVAAGPHRWDQLLGGECLGAYPGPWAERYTVVDCGVPHPAQMVYRGRFADPATPGFPGAAELQKQMSVLCSAPGVIDLVAASRYTDAQIEASYPVTAKQWDAGDHWYYCFVSRSSKEPLTGSLAAPHAGS